MQIAHLPCWLDLLVAGCRLLLVVGWQRELLGRAILAKSQPRFSVSSYGLFGSASLMQ